MLINTVEVNGVRVTVEAVEQPTVNTAVSTAPTEDRHPIFHRVVKSDNPAQWPNAYLVYRMSSGQLVCSCPDAQYRDTICKHVIRILNGATS